MKILTGFSNYSIPFSIVLFLALFPFTRVQAQVLHENSLFSHYQEIPTDTTSSESAVGPGEYPDPNSVLFKSMIVPGWGQVVNGQTWKVPVVYALLGGIGWYSIYLTKRYHDYRAAYYNVTAANNDLRFGSTPGYISPAANPESLKNTRDRLRNRRDFTYIAIVLAYGLNILDAYVYAHMRTFDVSEELSLRTDIRPTIFTRHVVPGVSVSIRLFNRSQTR